MITVNEIKASREEGQVVPTRIGDCRKVQCYPRDTRVIEQWGGRSEGGGMRNVECGGRTSIRLLDWFLGGAETCGSHDSGWYYRRRAWYHRNLLNPLSVWPIGDDNTVSRKLVHRLARAE